MKIGFLGLGTMGRPMAANLARAGHDVTLWNRTREKADVLAQEVDARVADTPAGCVAGVELAITMLSDDEAVDEVVLGTDGAIEGLPPGAVHASMSTLSVAFSRRLAEAHSDRGQRYVAAPVFGRPDMARSGDLFVVAAGPDDAVEDARPAFEAIGQAVIGVGAEVERANVVKLAGNFLLIAAIEAMGEAFALVGKHGIEPAEFLAVANGLFRSPIYEGYGGSIVAGTHEPGGFALRHGLKDLRYALSASDAAAVPMPVAGAIRDRFLTGIARGWGDLDVSALGRVAAEAAGVDR